MREVTRTFTRDQLDAIGVPFECNGFPVTTEEG